jgi:hypothetical protein
MREKLWETSWERFLVKITKKGKERMQKVRLLSSHLLSGNPRINLFFLALHYLLLKSRSASCFVLWGLRSILYIHQLRRFRPHSHFFFFHNRLDLVVFMIDYILCRVYFHKYYIGQRSKVIIIARKYREFKQYFICKEIFCLFLFPISFKESLQILRFRWNLFILSRWVKLIFFCYLRIKIDMSWETSRAWVYIVHC